MVRPAEIEAQVDGGRRRRSQKAPVGSGTRRDGLVEWRSQAEGARRLGGDIRGQFEMRERERQGGTKGSRWRKPAGA